jgi:hypothetical protein
MLKKSSPLKLLGQMEPNLTGSIYVRSSIKLLHLVPFGQQAWPLLLKIEHIQKHTSGGGPSNEHFWQVWLKSVQLFQRRRFKCEKLTDGQTDGRRTLTHDKSSPGLWPWPGEHNVFLLAEILKIFLSETTKPIEL